MINKTQKGTFITLEGIEGAGKSTHIRYIHELLSQAGKKVLTTREPGGTDLGERIRDILLMQHELNIDAESELLLMFAARSQHLKQVILPALANGIIVLCDRFTDSTYAYQGGGRGVVSEKIDRLANLVHPNLKPDLTLLLDLPVDIGLERASKNGEADRFESEAVLFFESARQVYLNIAIADPGRVKVVNAIRDIDHIQQEIKSILQEHKLC